MESPRRKGQTGSNAGPGTPGQTTFERRSWPPQAGARDPGSPGASPVRGKTGRPEGEGREGAEGRHRAQVWTPHAHHFRFLDPRVLTVSLPAAAISESLATGRDGEFHIPRPKRRAGQIPREDGGWGCRGEVVREP